MTDLKLTHTYSLVWLKNHQKMMRTTIRNASKPDAPHLIDEWLHFEQELLTSKGSHFSAYVDQCRLLLETVCDELLPSYWRCSCLDALNKPLYHLKMHASSSDEMQTYSAFVNEIRMMTHFISAGLSSQAAPLMTPILGVKPYDSNTH